MQHFNRERVPERVVHAKGGGAHGFFEVTDDVTPVHQGLVPVAGRQAHRRLRPLLDGGRRAGLRRHRARPARLRAEVLYRGRQLRHGRQQHAGLLRPRPVEVPGLHPLPEAPARHRPALQRHAVGLLDAVARERPPGHDPDVRPRDPGAAGATWTASPATPTRGSTPPASASGSSTTSRRSRASATSPRTRRRAWPARTATTIAATCIARSPSGDAPEWRFFVQVMPFADAADYRFNPFDLTKVWPQGDYPLIEVGRMVLDRNPANFFAEVEQAGFNPSNLVPGHRPVAGPDAHGAHLQLPRHASAPHRPELRAAADQPPACPVHSYNKDGQMTYHHAGSQPVYAPNSYGGPAADPAKGDRDRLGRRRRRAGAHGLREARRRRRLLPAGHARARGHGRRGARGARRRTSSATPPTRCRPRCSCG